MVNHNVKSSEQGKTSIGWPKLRIIQHLWKIAHSGFSRLPGCFQLPVYDCTAVAVTCGGLLPFSLGGGAVLLEPVRGRGNWFQRAGRLGSRSSHTLRYIRAHPDIPKGKLYSCSRATQRSCRKGLEDIISMTLTQGSLSRFRKKLFLPLLSDL